jgi:hypothetical protein
MKNKPASRDVFFMTLFFRDDQERKTKAGFWTFRILHLNEPRRRRSSSSCFCCCCEQKRENQQKINLSESHSISIPMECILTLK